MYVREYDFAATLYVCISIVCFCSCGCWSIVVVLPDFCLCSAVACRHQHPQVAWLFNIRGSDILYNPVTFAAAVLTQEKAFLFVDSRKLGEDVNQVWYRPHAWVLWVSPVRKESSIVHTCVRSGSADKCNETADSLATRLSCTIQGLWQ